MINDMDRQCPKCGGIMERKDKIVVGSSSLNFLCHCEQCGHEDIITHISTVIDIPPESNE